MGTILAPTKDSAYIHSYAMAFAILTMIHKYVNLQSKLHKIHCTIVLR